MIINRKPPRYPRRGPSLPARPVCDVRHRGQPLYHSKCRRGSGGHHAHGHRGADSLGHGTGYDGRVEPRQRRQYRGHHVLRAVRLDPTNVGSFGPLICSCAGQSQQAVERAEQATILDPENDRVWTPPPPPQWPRVTASATWVTRERGEPAIRQCRPGRPQGHYHQP